MPKKYSLEEIDPTEIAFDKANPRGEKPEQIKEDPSFIQLVDSVYEYGVLVPVVVLEQKGAGKKPYRLIDGERRLRAALKTSTSKIPAHIAPSGDSMVERMRAFHIHMLRKQWSNTAQARALKSIIRELNAMDFDDKDLFQELQALTGYSKSQLKSLLRGSKYSLDILNDVDNKIFSWSHLVQNEASFIEQLKEHYPKTLKSIGEKKVRKVLISKAKRKVLSSTRALMENIVPVIQRAQTPNERNFVENLLFDFIDEADSTAESVLNSYEKKFPDSQKDLLEIISSTLVTTEKLETLLKSIEISQLMSYPASAKKLKDNLDALNKVMIRQRRALKNNLKV